MTVRTRFAPSPTGFMHIGVLRTALYGYLFTKKQGGQFILRIEDTDQERYVEGATEFIYRTLKETGLVYDEGPDVGGPVGPYIQSERKEIYKQYAKELIDNGNAYYCFCSKERLDHARDDYAARNETFKYDKHCLHLSQEEVQKRLASGEPYVIRQNVPSSAKVSFDDAVFGFIEVETDTLDDIILMKSDGLPTYNFANVVDDHLMGITHIMRGSEFLSSTPKFNLLYQAFGWEPPLFIHLPPVMKNQHQKLSKRNGDASFWDLIDKGYLKEAVLNYIALLGWNPGTNQEIFSLEELVQAFDLSGISKSPAMFDPVKLSWMNSEYIKALPFDTFHAMALPWYEMAGVMNFDILRLSQMLQSRVDVFCRIPEMADFLLKVPNFSPELYNHKKMKTDAEVARVAVAVAYEYLLHHEDWSEQGLHDGLIPLAVEKELKTGQLLWPLRVAISGKESTPGGAVELCYLLGKQETLSRLQKALARLKE